MLGRTRNVQMPSKVQLRLLFLACSIEACCCYSGLSRRSPTPNTADVDRRLSRFSLLCIRCVSRPAARRAPRTAAPNSRSRPHLPPDTLVEPGNALGRHFRYVWDGRVQLAGINPYLYAPSAPEVAHLRDALYQSINHATIPTIYPPLAQLFFRAICALSATPAAFKLALLLCDWGLCLLLAHSLVRRGQDPRRVVLYAWNPPASSRDRRQRPH